MNVVKKVFDAIRDHKRNIESEIDTLEAEKETLEQQRETLRIAPRTKAEVVADIERLLDLHKAEYARRLISQLSAVGLVTKWMNSDFQLNPAATENRTPSINLLAIPADVGNNRMGHDMVDRLCLVGLLSGTVKDSVRTMLEAATWPAGAITQEERQERLTDIDGRLARVDERLAELFNGAREAGIKLFESRQSVRERAGFFGDRLR